MENKLRQAIVVIHGMGEQRPNDILNAFVEGVISENLHRVSRPDKVSGSYDSRRIQVLEKDEKKEEEKKGEVFTQTEIYEYHWAHLMAGNKLGHLFYLIKRFMLCKSVPERLKPVWWFIVLLIIALIVVLSAATLQGIEFNLESIIAAAGLGTIAIIIVKFLLEKAGIYLTLYFGDVARYLDAAPCNQAARDNIRQGLVDILEGLHNTNRYSRIIIVAHSLGSFIAYDAITYLWARMNKLHARKPGQFLPAFNELKSLEEYGLQLDQEDYDPRPDELQQLINKTENLRKNFRNSQRKAWIEKRLNGNPWLITDLFTFGSPLAHAQIFMTPDKEQLINKQEICELPRCPPVPDPLYNEKVKKGYSWMNEFDHPVLHFAAPFAIVRWTNFWFPSDRFAGPIAPNFGYGIHDVQLDMDSWFTKVPLLSHIYYFKAAKNKGIPNKRISDIRNLLELNAGKWLEKTLGSPSPDPETQNATGKL